MKLPRVAIIDSGISYNQIKESYKVDVIGAIQKPIDNLNHGSVIFNIIKKYCPKVCLRCIKITDDVEIQEEYLCAALKLLLEDLDVDIINISMGIVVGERLNELAELCLQLRSKGIIIISAFDNDGAMSYPAAYPFVIGVDTASRCRLISQYEYVEDNVVNIRAFSGVLHIKVDDKVLSVSGTSFACAIMTAKIANLFYAGIIDYEELLKQLEEKATYIVTCDNFEPIQEMIDIEKAIIFPINKEMNALLSNQDLLQFEVIGIYDPVQLGNVGRKLSDMLRGELKKNFTVESIMDVNWKNDFDTVVLGHTREISEALNFDFKAFIIQQCEKHNKKLYSFDNIDVHRNLQFYIPRVLDINVPKNRFGKLYQVQCPVLGVFGTSAKQGKFSLQLKLRRCFLDSNYRIVQIGTEPSSMLFGMSAVYPMGYDGIVPSDSRDAIITLNDMLNANVDQDTDVVLVGSQSGSNVYSCQNVSLFPLETYNFLLATQPDAILLCVNIYDDDEYIYRTIMTLENMINTYVIALIISPISYENINSGLSRKVRMEEPEKLESFKTHLIEMFKREVFIFKFEDDARTIFEYCIKVLSEGYKRSDL